MCQTPTGLLVLHQQQALKLRVRSRLFLINSTYQRKLVANTRYHALIAVSSIFGKLSNHTPFLYSTCLYDVLNASLDKSAGMRLVQKRVL